MLLLHREDALEHAARRRIVVREIPDHLAVAVDRDALGDQVLLDHVDQGASRDVLGMAPGGEPLRREVGLAAELHDARRDLVRVALLLVRVLEELGRDGLGMDAGRHEVVPLVPEHADDLGGQRFVQKLDHRLGVGAVTRRHRALADVLAGALPEGLDVRQEGLPAILALVLGHVYLTKSIMVFPRPSARSSAHSFRLIGAIPTARITDFMNSGEPWPWNASRSALMTSGDVEPPARAIRASDTSASARSPSATDASFTSARRGVAPAPILPNARIAGPRTRSSPFKLAIRPGTALPEARTLPFGSMCSSADAAAAAVRIACSRDASTGATSALSCGSNASATGGDMM